MNAKYFLGSLLVAPLLPVMYIQSRIIRSKVPKLGEASGDSGRTGSDSGKSAKVIILGESTMAGVGVKTHKEGFPGSFAESLSQASGRIIEWKVYAKSGFTAKEVRISILPEIAETEADLIVIGLGGNDTFSLNSPSRWRNDILKLVIELRGRFPDTPLVFTNMPPIAEFPAFNGLIRVVLGNLVDLLGEELKQLAEKLDNVYYYSRKITLKDWISRLGIDAEPEDFFSDGVHPSRLTYQVWAKDLCRYLFEETSLPSNW